LVLEPTRRPYSIEELVAAITDENRHVASDWGASLGCEEP